MRTFSKILPRVWLASLGGCLSALPEVGDPNPPISENDGGSFSVDTNISSTAKMEKTVHVRRMGGKAFTELVWNGSGYGMIQITTENNQPTKVFFLGLDDQGNEIIPPLTITEVPDDMLAGASFVWTGVEYGLIWSHWQGGGIYFSTIDGDGREVSPIKRLIGSQLTGISHLSWNGSKYITGWSAMREAAFYLAEFDRDGNIIGNTIRLPHPFDGQVAPLITSAGKAGGLVWSNIDTLYFTPFDLEQENFGDRISIAGSIAQFGGVSLIWNGKEYATSWFDRAINFARVDRDGNKTGETSYLTDYSVKRSFDFVWNGSEYGLVYIKTLPNGEEQVFFARIGRDGHRIGDELQATTGPDPSKCCTNLGWNDRRREYGLMWQTEATQNFARITGTFGD